MPPIPEVRDAEIRNQFCWDGAFTTAPDPEQAKLISDFRIADFWYRRHFLYEELAK